MNPIISFEPDYWRRPHNGLVKALQERLIEILNHPGEFGITDAYTLKSLMQVEAKNLAKIYTRSPLEEISFKVTKFPEFDDQLFEMEHKRDNIAACARCVFALGEKKFYPAGSYDPVPGPFGRIVVEIRRY
jgi:hypothetical protein